MVIETRPTPGEVTLTSPYLNCSFGGKLYWSFLFIVAVEGRVGVGLVQLLALLN